MVVNFKTVAVLHIGVYRGEFVARDGLCPIYHYIGPPTPPLLKSVRN